MDEPRQFCHRGPDIAGQLPLRLPPQHHRHMRFTGGSQVGLDGLAAALGLPALHVLDNAGEDDHAATAVLEGPPAAFRGLSSGHAARRRTPRRTSHISERNPPEGTGTCRPWACLTAGVNASATSEICSLMSGFYAEASRSPGHPASDLPRLNEPSAEPPPGARRPRIARYIPSLSLKDGPQPTSLGAHPRASAARYAISPDSARPR